MAAEILLGEVVGRVLGVITDAIEKARKFKPELEKLKSTLESITPNIKAIVKSNENLDRPKQETEKLIGLLRNAEELVRKCSKQKKWYSFKKITLADDLIELNESIKNYCMVDLQVQDIRDGKEVLELVHSIKEIVSGNEQVGGVFNRVKSNEIYGPSSVPDLREKTYGLDAPMKELRTELLKVDGKQVIVVSAPGGAGKTTLVKKLCADDQVKVQETAKLKEEMAKGMELVLKCSEVKCCCFKRVNYADKLIKQNQCIERICKIDMLTQLLRDNKEILEQVEDNQDIGVLNSYTNTIDNRKQNLEASGRYRG
ncbi:hypothetical protein Dsin_009876 [Dipteronia sinensis]|uniref:RPW8 domain-containing protein n=1 Tax=Dipteronia sinensis TaxID=43782 RepID=A0AAE0ARA7_9ROSI|nr:hypothetical protein Dsin_009876 [Dipteronia sinensis]